MIDLTLLGDKEKVIIRVHNTEQWFDVRENICGINGNNFEPRGEYPWCIRANLVNEEYGFDSEENYINGPYGNEYSMYLPIIDYEDLVASGPPCAHLMEVFEDLF